MKIIYNYKLFLCLFLLSIFSYSLSAINALSDETLFENYTEGTRADPKAKSPIIADTTGRVILNLGDRAKTVIIDENTQYIHILNKLTEINNNNEGGFKSQSEIENIADGFGIHVAATADPNQKNYQKSQIDILDNEGNLSVELLKLFTIAELGGYVGTDDDINLRLGTITKGNPTTNEGYSVEIFIDGRDKGSGTTTDILQIKDKLARDLLVASGNGNNNPIAVNDIISGQSEFYVNDIKTGHQETPRLTQLEGGGFVVTWYSNDNQQDTSTGIKAKVFDRYGNVITPEFLVNEITESEQYRSNVAALEGGGFIIVWDSYTNGRGEVKARVFDDKGKGVISEFLVDNSLGVNDRGFAVATGLEGGGFAIAWQSDLAPSDESAISVKSYDASGNEILSNLKANQVSTNTQQLPSITSIGEDRFVVTWESTDRVLDTDRNSIKAIILSNNGYTGPEFLVNENKIGGQIHSDVTTLENGQFVISWQTFDINYQTGQLIGEINLRIFDNNGNTITPDISVTELSGGYDRLPRVSALKNGGFVVVWITQDLDGVNSQVVKARMYNADGTPKGSEFIVHADSIYDQYTPDVTGLPGGGFVVTWMAADDPQDPSGVDLKARIFDENGQTIDREDSIRIFSISSLLSNDNDVDGDTLIVTSVSSTSENGADITLNGDRTITYNPGSIFSDLNDGDFETDSFEYSISDGNGGTSTAKVMLKVFGKN